MEPLEYITLTPQETGKLLSAGNGDAALLYLYLKATGDTRLLHAQNQLRMSTSTLGWAESLLKQLGLLDIKSQPPRFEKASAPTYTGEAVTAFAAGDPSFVPLQGEFSRRLGRVLTSEELKILLSIRDYLKLPPEVVGMVLTFCLQRNEYYNQLRGQNRSLSMRTVETECYKWANQGIVTLEAAAAYISRNLDALGPENQVKRLLQIDHPLVDSEREYIRAWLDWGMEPEVIRSAYEKTLMATGKLAWKYMNKILLNWHEKGLHSPSDIQSGDKKAPAGGDFTPGESELSAVAELAARRRKAAKED